MNFSKSLDIAPRLYRCFLRIVRNISTKYIFLILSPMFVLSMSGILGAHFWSISEVLAVSTGRSNIYAGVVPHHLLAKDLIEDFFVYISSRKRPETVVLLSPDHFNTASILGNSFITLPPETHEFYGIEVDGSLIRALSFRNSLIFNNAGVSLEHGITNLISFMKKYLPGTKIVPLVIPCSISRKKVNHFTSCLNSTVSLKTIVIASVDFSHYLPPRVAQFHDIKSIRTLINFEKENFENLEVDSWQSLYIARAFAQLRGGEFPEIIGYSNSADFLKGEYIEKSTSYFSVVFKEESLEDVKGAEEFKGKTILLVGDIMLNRGVEYLMNKNSRFYPVQKISQFLRGVDIVFGNLEGPVTEDCREFSENFFKFAFKPAAVDTLRYASFNLLSLANNHTLDRGLKGLDETRKHLEEQNIKTVGDPLSCGQDFCFQKENIIFLAFNIIVPLPCRDEEIIKTITLTRSQNPESFLIVSVHWGQEYQLRSSLSQQRLSHKIVDAGADLIIGHHPHVVQDIEIYKGKCIFYSLGNFIFDQYFSKETQQSLAVGLEIYPSKLVYRLFPLESNLSQPCLMPEEKAREFLRKLALKSCGHLSDQIKTGIIQIQGGKINESNQQGKDKKSRINI